MQNQQEVEIRFPIAVISFSALNSMNTNDFNSLASKAILDPWSYGCSLRPPGESLLRIFRHFISLIPLMLFAGDSAVLFLACHTPKLMGTWIAEAAVVPRLVLVVGVVSFVLNLGGLYDVRLPLGRRELLARLLTCQAVAGLLVAAVGFAIPSLRLGRAAFLQIGAGATLGLFPLRAPRPRGQGRPRVRILAAFPGSLATRKRVPGAT